MKNLIAISLLVFTHALNAQVSFELKGVVEKNISANLKEGQDVVLKKMTNFSSFLKATVAYDNKEEAIDYKNLDKISFEVNNLDEFWQFQGIRMGAYENILKSGLQYNLRKEMSDEALEYLRYLESNNLIFHDSYLENYLYTLLFKIHPYRLNDGRPGNLNIKIIKDISPNAFVFANGSIFISTGLLSTINSEAELISIMAHEVSHFILDHAIININKTTARQKSAEFWATFATVIAAGADIYAASKNPYYTLGDLTLGTAILASSIAESINHRFGLKFSREQEIEADQCAVDLLKFINVNPGALSSALTKIKNYCVATGNYLSLSGEGTHPAIDERIKSIGRPLLQNDPNYEKLISFVNTCNAEIEFHYQNFLACKDLTERNIISGVATEDDYLMLAMATICMDNSEEKNLQALGLINTAKKLNVYPPINLPKQEAIVLLRLNKNVEALESLIAYRELLEIEKSNFQNIYSHTEWLGIKQFIDTELEWTQKMIHKVKNL